MIPYAASLGHRLEQAWLARGRDEQVFAELACEHLRAHPPAGALSVDEIVDWVFSINPGVTQPEDMKFGQPPVKLYQGRGFFIEALFWTTSTTAIHQHGFSGAFTPIAGSSVHTAWRFESERRLSSRLHVGRLERLSTEHLQVGEVRRILPGTGFVHQLFHLESPSVTLVARTSVETEHQPQYSYVPPGVAFDPFYSEPLLERRLALLELMKNTGAGDFERHAEGLLCSGDAFEAFRGLTFLALAQVDDALLARLLAAARGTHGEIVDHLYAAATHERRIRLISKLRKQVTAPEPRFLLALLMLLPERDAILEVVAARHPERDPRATVMAWLEALSGLDLVGIEFDEVNQIVFRALLDGCDDGGVLAALGEVFDAGDIDAQRDDILAHAGAMARSEVFAALFSESPLVPASGQASA